MNCIFCDIISRKADAKIVYEDEKVISFLDIRPVNFGHLLVVPKCHCKDFLEIPKEFLAPLIHGTQIVANAIVKSINPDGYNIVSNNGIAAGQSVFHFHNHIIPRYNNDDFKVKLNLKEYKETQMLEFAEKIRKEVVKF